jgi:hypothetical protein
VEIVTNDIPVEVSDEFSSENQVSREFELMYKYALLLDSSGNSAIFAEIDEAGR